MKILVVDDDATSRLMLEVSIRKIGHEVVSAVDGQEAWEKYQAEQFPIVVSDWMMPRVDGLEFCRRVRAHPCDHYTFFILLTGRNDKESVVEGFAAGADDFVGKPFYPGELAARIHSGERIIQLETQLSARVKELGHVNEKMRRDLAAAARIQVSMLPAAPPPVDAFTVAWKLKSCEDLAGDMLNVFALGPRHVGLYVLDVSGHGVSSSLLAVTLSRILSPVPSQSVLFRRSPDGKNQYELVPPAKVLKRLNEQFPISETTGGQYFTILYGIYDLDTASFCYASAGHPQLIIQPAGAEPFVTETESMPIGFMQDETYDEHTVNLHKGDRLILYSDGLKEAADPDGKEFGFERILDCLQQYKTMPLQNCIDGLVDCVLAWGAKSAPEDDISVLALEQY